MNPDAFDLLKTETKRRLVTSKGILLAKRVTENYKVYLFQLYSFYAEMVVSKKGGEVEWVNTFNDVEHLEPYLAYIDIKEVEMLL